ncbi:MAG: bacteriophage Gp15 family protein [Lachnospiraceae bacterium]|nr:bacteriophage Gp15 family protein [Lachnospiraceae bacterium]
MGFLTDYKKPYVRYKGCTYHVNAAYDSVLNIQRMYREEKQMEESEKTDLALSILIGNTRQAWKLSYPERAELLALIFREHIETKKRPHVGRAQRLLDFEEDGEYIYASFLQDYGIDLIDMQGKLSWRKFIALFEGLGEKTKIKEVMRIRGMEIPKPNSYNQKEIQRIQELKMYYALPAGDQEHGLDVLFSTLERMAGKGG